MTEILELERTISALEAQREALGGMVAETAIQTLRARLAELRHKTEPVESQLKFVSVLFTDIVGSTHLSQHLDTEDVMAVMDGALRKFRLVIEAHGGRVLRFMGDGLKAAFGVPKSREDDAERAVRAGLALLEEARQYAGQVDTKWHLPGFNIRVGVNTGQVIVGGGVEEDRTAMGMTINLAARLESNAPEGGLLISRATYRHVQGIFEVEPLAPRLVKGRDEPLIIYQVLGLRQRAFWDTGRGVEGVQTRLVGRAAELTRLKEIWQTVVDEHTARVITIVGEAGIGKSRLVDEFENWQGGQIHRSIRLHARSVVQNIPGPHSLLRDLFADYCHIGDNDPPETVRLKLRAGLREFLEFTSDEPLELIEDFLGFHTNQGISRQGALYEPEVLRSRAVAILGDFLSKLSQKSPLMFILDDLHRADAASLAAIREILRNERNLRLAVVCLARPALFEVHPEWSSGDGGEQPDVYHQIDLAALSESESEMLVAEILSKVPDLPLEVRQRIVDQAEGNPYYMEELVNILVDDGILIKVQGEANWRVDFSQIEQARVPPTLTAVLQARMENLPVDERRILGLASVMGRYFWDGAIEQILGNAGYISPALASLSERGVIYSRQGAALQGMQVYAFQHSMLREVVYEMLLKTERRRWHNLVAEWMANAWGEIGRELEFAAQIADHYERGGSYLEAAAWYLQAAEQAKRQGVPKEAQHYFTQAIGHLPPEAQETRWRAFAGRNEVLCVVGEMQLGQEDARQMLALAQAMQDAGRIAEAHYRIGYTWGHLGDLVKEEAAYQEALVLGAQAGRVDLEILVGALTAINQAKVGHFAAAEGLAERALVQAEQLGDLEVLARALLNVANCCSLLGDLARSVQLARRQVEVCRKLDNRWGIAIGLGNLGYMYVCLGLVEEGRTALEQALEMTQLLGVRQLAAYIRLNLSLAEIYRRDPAAAQTLIAQAFSELSTIGDKFGQASSGLYLGIALEALDELDLASQHYTRARDDFQEMGVSGNALDATAGVVRIDLARENIDQAQPEAEKLWDALLQHGTRGLEFPALAYLACAEYFRWRGESSQAKKALEAGYRHLQGRAAKISNPDWRRAFLENVPHHRQLLERWAEVVV